MNLFGVTRSGGSRSNLLLLKSFAKLVATLRTTKSTCTVVEQSCGGIIASSILMQPGASQVFYGSGVIYNTVQSMPLLVLNNNDIDDSLYQSFIQKKPSANSVELFERSYNSNNSSGNLVMDDEMKQYIQSKIDWTRHAAIQYCSTLKTDYAIAEGGAVGPTFRPSNMNCGFSVIAIAGKKSRYTSDSSDDENKDDVTILRQEIIYSPHNDRVENMYSFAQIAAEICTSTIIDQQSDIPTDHTSNTSNDAKKETTSNDSSSISNSNNSDAAEVASKIFDRVTHLRANTDHIHYLQHTSLGTKFIILNNSKQILVHNNNMFENIAYLSRDEVQQLINLDDKNTNILTDSILSTSFLGVLKDDEIDAIDIDQIDKDDSIAAIFAVDVSTIPESINSKMKEKYTFVDTRTTLPLFPNVADTEIALYGTALAEWKRRNKYCTNCGSSNISYNEGGGNVGQCMQCNTKFWPRQDPSMIVLIVSRDQQRVLLANHVRHKNRMIYTTLAGFVEVGETFESAVAREVYEETGIRVDLTLPIQYIGSQPWPFPQSCMIGFIASADDTSQAINIDENEIYDAKWFDKSEVLEASKIIGSTLQSNVTEMVMKQNPNLSCVIPPKGVIARKLIDTWLEQEPFISDNQTSHFVQTKLI